jgi:hypothetical protein
MLKPSLWAAILGVIEWKLRLIAAMRRTAAEGGAPAPNVD